MKVYCGKRQDAKGLATKVLEDKDLVFSINQYGKPFIVNKKSAFFNTTHTKSLTFLVLCDEEVGIDAEDIEEYDYRIPQDYFTEDEQAYVNKSDNKNRAFFEIWTLKESFMKYKGKGFHLPPKSFSVRKDCACAFYHEIINGSIALSICCKQKQPFGEICFLKEN